MLSETKIESANSKTQIVAKLAKPLVINSTVVRFCKAALTLSVIVQEMKGHDPILGQIAEAAQEFDDLMRTSISSAEIKVVATIFLKKIFVFGGVPSDSLKLVLSGKPSPEKN